jgi:diguanylate cyclase (GGDEF)-like protein
VSPTPVFAMAVFLTVLTGGLLGLMQRDLPESMQAAATWWRRSTLLVAGGVALMGAQQWLPLGLGTGLGNGMMMVGITGYWVAIRRFYQLGHSMTQWLPALTGAVVIPALAFAGIGFAWRSALATALWCWVGGGVILDLRRASNDRARSRLVMQGLFGALMFFMVARALYLFVSQESSLVDDTLLSVLTPAIAALLPILGTTIFLLLASERLLREWERAASIDALTGLANRRTVTADGHRRLASTQATAVAVIDIDHFKAVNDRYGHDGGDKALIHVAQCLQRACRSADLAARQGGEEFIVLFECTTDETAVAVGERLRTAVERSAAALPGNVSLRLTVSIGVALAVAGDTLDSVIRRADTALYRAKTNGRNRVEYHRLP